MRLIARVGMPLVLVAASAALAHAQGMGNSVFGSAGLGGGSLGSTGSFTSGFGNAGFGSTRFGTGSGSLGAGGFGNSGFGSTRFGSSGMGDFNSGGMGGGMGGMTGSGGQNFVGRSGSDMQALNQMGQAGSNFFSQMNRNMRRQQRQENASPVVASSPQPVRVDLKVAFSAPQPASDAVETKLRARLAKILPEHNMTQPAINMEGDTVILSGVAASESEIMVLERLVSLEPGVRQVRNEMTVAGAVN